MDLFDLPSSALSAVAQDALSEDALTRASRRIRALLVNRHPIALAFSSGKDSSALASVTLATAAQLHREGVEIPPIIIVNSDTGVEQPEIVLR